MNLIKHIVRKEFLQFKRDPKMFGIVLIAPVVQLILLGYAATLDVNVVHTIVYDMDKTVESRRFVREFESSGFFQTDYYVNSYEEVEDHLNKADALTAIVIPRGFQESIERRETAKVQTIFDGSDGNTASIAAGYISRVTADYAKDILLEYMEQSGRKVKPSGSVSAEVRVWYNPLMTTRYFMVPAIVGLLLSIVTLILTSLAVVKEKEIGTFEQVIVTPVKPYQLIIGKLIPFTILGFISVIVVLTAMRLIFDIPVRGSIVFLFVSSFFYILSTLGLGLFVSTISKTQQQAMMISIFGIMMPMVYLSGFAFPIENMPEIIQYISYIIPLRYFITIVRGIILKGVGFAELWGQGVVLLIMGAAILYLSALRFKKRID